MARVKTLLTYALILILFYIFSNFLINIGINISYKNIESKSSLPYVNITKAEATHINGKIYGEIDLQGNNDLVGKYLKYNLYSKRNVLLGTNYIKIEKTENENKQKLEEYFKYTDVSSYDLAIIDEQQKERELKEVTDKSLFEGFTAKDMEIGEILWISIIAVALFA